jgi:hypothetical protein
MELKALPSQDRFRARAKTKVDVLSQADLSLVSESRTRGVLGIPDKTNKQA